jgi:hypothetical protein
VVTEGSSDSKILERALQIRRPEIKDFFISGLARIGEQGKRLSSNGERAILPSVHKTAPKGG